MTTLRPILVTLFLAFLFFLLPRPGQAALNAYLTLADGQDNPIVGECTQAGREGTTEVYAFGHNLHMPYDPATGVPTGAKAHTPLQIYKLVDSISPLLNQIMVSNEGLSTFVLDFWRPTRSGAEENYFRITLDKARIVKITPSMANNKIPENMQLNVAETVSFTYGTITWTSLVPTPISKSDTWATP